MQTDYEIGIVGTGFAGLVAALRLKRSGRESFVIFERAAEIGGTWRDNVYPGCACDVASPMYSFAQEPNPDWSHLYSSQSEILAYLKAVVKKNDLEKHIRYNSDITEAKFQQERGRWLVTDRDGKETSLRILILGTGPLNRPHCPEFQNQSLFKGKIFHSAQWDQHYDFTGKRVAVIGTGASAIQIIPSLAPAVDHLTVFQRTPAWVTPRMDKKISDAKKKQYRNFPFLLKAKRESIYWLNEFVGLGFIGNENINRLMRNFAVRRLARHVTDPEMRRKLTPDYKIGCKRILRSDDYYKMFNRENVALVTDPIQSFIEDGIVANGALHKLDAVVLATGFVAADIEFYLKIIGVTGQNLVDEWKETGAEAYLGTTVAGYPNLCFILGPNTGLGNNSVVHIMESQMNYIMQYIEHLEKSGDGSFLDVKRESQKTYNEALQKKFAGTVWSSGCKSWYLNRAGKNTTLYPRLSVTFRNKTKKFDPAVYTLLNATALI